MSQVPFCQSTIGRKLTMAVTGALLIVFILLHLLGNATAFGGRHAFVAYAHGLHRLGPLVTVFEIMLAAVFAVHVVTAIGLFVHNRRARPQGYAAPRPLTGLAAETMPVTGLAILFFVAVHLAVFRFGGQSHDVAHLVRTTLGRPLTAGFYIVCLAALALHISHGAWSLVQTLGLHHQRANRLLEQGAVLLAVFVGAVFISIPVLVQVWDKFLQP